MYLQNKYRKVTRQTIYFFVLCWLNICIHNSIQAENVPTLYINYSRDIPQNDLLAYDVCILAPVPGFIPPQKVSPSQQFLGYLSVCEIAPDAIYRDEAFAAGTVSIGKNNTWKSDFIEPQQKAWQDFVVNQLAQRILKSGFDGFFLDTPESVEYLAELYPEKRQSYYDGLESLVKRLREHYPKAKIVMNRGFSVLPKLYTTVDGVLVESLFRAYDYDKKAYIPTPTTDTDFLLPKLHSAKKAGLQIYVTDFVAPQATTLAQSTAERITNEGFIPLITTYDLMGTIIAPLRTEPRRWLSLYGAFQKDGSLDWPEDTDAFTCLQMPLEYLGYEVRHHNLNTEDFPEPLGNNDCGVIIDSNLDIPVNQQIKFVDWLIDQKNNGKKIIFIGALPNLSDHETKRLATALDMKGSLRSVSGMRNVRILKKDTKLSGFEAPLIPRPNDFSDIQAPANATVFISAGGECETGEPCVFDAVFTADWGGLAIDPYLTTLDPEKCAMLIPNIFSFLEGCLNRSPIPAPDATTRQGRRIYFSHIDGDGFLNFSEIEKGKRSGAVILDKIINAYGLPITASLIESEVNGESKIYQPREGESFTDLGRKLMAHPLVESASHTYSHPFFWSKEDRTSRNYKAQSINIGPEYHTGSIELKREIVDSVRNIREQFNPPGKELRVLFWSGNCRASPQALKMCREAGLINLNGGLTTITRLAPFLSLVSPRSLQWHGETQIYTPMQNENLFNNALGNDRFGGYTNVIQTFKMTDEPRRLKPLNAYYHFYSADRFDAFTALKRVMDYCLKQPMHPMRASEYVDIANDCTKAGIYNNTTNGKQKSYIIVNGGYAQTLRLPKSAGYPDLSISNGVLGYDEYLDSRYIHTDGSRRVVLTLTDTPPIKPYLKNSRAFVKTMSVSKDTIALTIHNPTLHPLAVTLAGLNANSRWLVKNGAIESIINVDTNGLLTFDAPPGEHTARIEKK